MRFALPSSVAGLLLLTLASAVAEDFTWNGGDGTWPSSNWTNVTTTANPVAGPTAGGNTATISAGTVTFAGNDTFGRGGVNATDGITSSPAITLAAGSTLNSGGFFTSMWDLELAGGTLLSDGGANANYPAFQLAGTLSVTGSQASTIAVDASPRNVNNAISLGGNGNPTLTLDVSDVTGDADADLTIAAVLKNRAAGIMSSLTKTGVGTATLSSANVYTGQTLVTGGILEVAAGGSVIGTNRVNALDGGELVIDGTLTVGDNGSFGIGTGEASAGTVTVNAGGTLNLGNGSGGTVGFAAIGGGFGSSGTAGDGTLSINNGGVVNVAAGGTGASSLDGNRFWLNPYLAGGSATINLNSGGLLSTARPISNGGSGDRPAFFFFDGGTLQAAGNTTLLMPQTNTITTRIKQGGAFIDTNGFDASITVALVDDTGATGSLTKQGGGTLTLTEANTFTGDITINGGTLVAGRSSNTSSPTASALGNLTAQGRTITVNSGATLILGDGNSDVLGAYQYKTPVTLVADGGTIQNGNTTFMSIGDIELKNGGTFNTQNGVGAAYQTFNLRGSVTVSGDSGSSITTSGSSLNGLHLIGTGTTFNVADTADTADLTVSAPLLDEVYGTGSLVKTGAGRMVLSSANVYTGQTLVTGGMLEVAAGGSVVGTNRVNVLDGGELVIDGTLTVGDNGSFGIGTGEATAGTVTVNSGGTLNLGNGNGSTVGFTGIGGRFGSSGTAGDGTLSINGGGVVNVAAGGTGASSLDGNRFWLNPYLAGGSATINLNSGGLLSTARPISNGSSSTATVVFDGGTLQAAADDVTLLIASTTSLAARIAAGGAIIDTNGFDASITVPLTDDSGATGSLTKQGGGTLTLSAASSFTGATTISQGTLALDAAGSFAGSSRVSLATGSQLDLTSKTAGFSFAAGQTLAGSGLVSLGSGRDLTILGGLAPGQSPGTLSVDGNLVLDAASTSLFEIEGETAGLYDLVQESGGSHTVTFDGTLSLSFTSGWSSATTLKLFDFTTYSGSFSQVQATGLASGYTASFNELTGEVVVVPEPTAVALGGLGVVTALGLSHAARRRSRHA